MVILKELKEGFLLISKCWVSDVCAPLRNYAYFQAYHSMKSYSKEYFSRYDHANHIA